MNPFLQALLDAHGEELAKTYVRRICKGEAFDVASWNAYDDVRPSAEGGSFTDPNTGLTGTLMSLKGTKLLNAERQAWNANRTRFALIYPGSGDTQIEIYNTSTWARVRTIDRNDGYEYWWHPTNPDWLFFVVPGTGRIDYLNVVTDATGNIVTFANYTFPDDRPGGGDGNHPDRQGRFLIGKKQAGNEQFVYDFVKGKVIDAAGTEYLPTTSFPRWTWSFEYDYAVCWEGYIVVIGGESGGTDLYDFSGRFIRQIYRRSPHFEPEIMVNASGIQYPGGRVPYNEADANYYTNLGYSSEQRTYWFHGWNPAAPGLFTRFSMGSMPAGIDQAATGGQYSGNLGPGLTGVFAMHGPSVDPTPPAFSHIYGHVQEYSLLEAEAVWVRRLFWHYIGYSNEGEPVEPYATNYQPEAFTDGEYLIAKLRDIGWVRFRIYARPTMAEVDAFLTGAPAPSSDFTSQRYTGSAWADVPDGDVEMNIGDYRTHGLRHRSRHVSGAVSPEQTQNLWAEFLDQFNADVLTESQINAAFSLYGLFWGPDSNSVGPDVQRYLSRTELATAIAGRMSPASSSFATGNRFIFHRAANPERVINVYRPQGIPVKDGSAALTHQQILDALAGTGLQYNSVTYTDLNTWAAAVVAANPGRIFSYGGDGKFIDFADVEGGATEIQVSALATLDILFVVANATTLEARDSAIRTLLLGEGHTVTLADDSTVVAGDATGKDLILISASVTDTDVNAMFAATAVPLVSCLAAATAGHSLASDASASTSQTQIRIVNTSHPITTGFAAGLVTVLTSGTGLQRGATLGAGAQVLAEHPTTAADKTLVLYEAGAAMTTGTAPARRAFCWLNGQAGQRMTADANTIFLRLITWAAT